MSKHVLQSQVTQVWSPVVDSTATQLIAESGNSFTVRVIYGPDDVQDISSMHDGIVHFVTVNVPLAAKVEVK